MFSLFLWFRRKRRRAENSSTCWVKVNGHLKYLSEAGVTEVSSKAFKEHRTHASASLKVQSKSAYPCVINIQ